MKSFIRENPTIALGLGLPIILVVIMLLSSGLSGMLVPAPQYDFLYATGYTDYNNGIRIDVVNKKAHTTYTYNGYYPQIPHLWYYDVKKNAVREISITLPTDFPSVRKSPPTDGSVIKSGAIPIPEIESLTLDSSSVAPDGYEFRVSGYGSSAELLTGMFTYRYNQGEPVLVKNGRSIRLPTRDSSYNSYQTHFVGWVIAQ